MPQPPHDESKPSAAGATPSRFEVIDTGVAWRFVAGILLIQALLTIAVLCIACTDWFLWHDAYPGLRNFGYAERAGSPGCEILIFGDSSSLTGLNPSIIQQITGLKTCNISEGITIQQVAGSDAPLQAYLRKNPAPRFLLGFWNATNFRPDIPAYSSYTIEGFLYSIRFGNRKEFVKHLLHHPAWVAHFALWSARALDKGIDDEITGKAQHQIDARAQRNARMGQWPYPPPPETHCVRGALNLGPDSVPRDEESVQTFRQKYSSAKTTVILDVAPAADCDTLYDAYQEQTAGLHENTLERLPIRFFNEGDVHFSPEGSRYISDEVGKQILDRMQHPQP